MFWKGICVSSLYKLPRDSIRSKQEKKPGLAGKVQLLPPLPASIPESITAALPSFLHKMSQQPAAGSEPLIAASLSRSRDLRASASLPLFLRVFRSVKARLGSCRSRRRRPRALAKSHMRTSRLYVKTRPSTPRAASTPRLRSGGGYNDRGSRPRVRPLCTKGAPESGCCVRRSIVPQPQPSLLVPSKLG
jgi:hypothetical protein